MSDLDLKIKYYNAKDQYNVSNIYYNSLYFQIKVKFFLTNIDIHLNLTKIILHLIMLHAR